MGGKARGDLVAAVAAKDVIGLSKAEARAAKEEVVLEILGDDRLSEKALSGLFMEAGIANGGCVLKSMTAMSPPSTTLVSPPI